MKNLKGLAEMVENCDDEYMKFNLDYDQVYYSLISLTLIHTHNNSLAINKLSWDFTDCCSGD